jgi:hypothetical protein
MRGKVSDEAILTRNARLCRCDKLLGALPRELSEPQRAALVQAFMGELTGARIPWYAAVQQNRAAGTRTTAMRISSSSTATSRAASGWFASRGRAMRQEIVPANCQGGGVSPALPYSAMI